NQAALGLTDQRWQHREPGPLNRGLEHQERVTQHDPWRPCAHVLLNPPHAGDLAARRRNPPTVAQPGVSIEGRRLAREVAGRRVDRKPAAPELARVELARARTLIADGEISLAAVQVDVLAPGHHFEAQTRDLVEQRAETREQVMGDELPTGDADDPLE